METVGKSPGAKMCYFQKPPGYGILTEANAAYGIGKEWKTMKRIFALLLALTMLFCACGQTPAETTPTTTVPETTEATLPPETTPPIETTVPPTTEATEPPPVDTNPLTGEALEEVSDLRPVAIMINNISKAVPQCGISQADLLYEIVAEGSVTRFMAIFSDLSDVGVIGPVRSVRPYFVRIGQHYNAIISSAGGSDEAIDLIKSLGLNYLNGIAGAGSYFYRDEWRRANRGFEHSLMTTGGIFLKKTFCTQLFRNPCDISVVLIYIERTGRVYEQSVPCKRRPHISYDSSLTGLTQSHIILRPLVLSLLVLSEHSFTGAWDICHDDVEEASQ